MRDFNTDIKKFAANWNGAYERRRFIGGLLKFWREYRGITAYRAAKDIGVTQTSIANLEAGKANQAEMLLNYFAYVSQKGLRGELLAILSLWETYSVPDINTKDLFSTIEE